MFRLILILPLLAQAANWQKLAAQGAPGQIAWTAAVYINGWKKLWIFGAGVGPSEDKYTCYKSIGTGGGGYRNNEVTFEYSSRTWTEIRPDHDVVDYSSYIETRRMNDAIPWPAVWAAEPAGRDNHQMVYDPVLDKVYLLGGTCHGDLFEYDIPTRKWYLLSTKGLYTDLPLLPASDPYYKTPSVIGEVFNCAMAFDYLNQRIIIYGGRLGPNCPSFGRCYAFDCKNPKATQRWVEIGKNNPVKPTIMESGENNAIYDPVGQKVIWFGGGTGWCGETALSETWELDCRTDTWSKVNSPVSPPARIFPNLVYDPYHRKAFLHGGSSGGTDTWAYDPAAKTWEKLAAAGPPNQRFGVGGYDLERRRFIHYTADGETWALTYEDGPEYPLIPYPKVAAEKQPWNARLSISPNPVTRARAVFHVGKFQKAALFDLKGRKMAEFAPVSGAVVWNTRNASPGVYVLRWQNGFRKSARKITLFN